MTTTAPLANLFSAAIDEAAIEIVLQRLGGDRPVAIHAWCLENPPKPAELDVSRSTLRSVLIETLHGHGGYDFHGLMDIHSFDDLNNIFRDIDDAQNDMDTQVIEVDESERILLLPEMQEFLTGPGEDIDDDGWDLDDDLDDEFYDEFDEFEGEF